MKIYECKGIDKKDLVNVTSGEYNLKDLVGMDSVTVFGAAIFETVDNVSGTVTGGVALKTESGVFAGISTGVYNAVECMLSLYTMKEIKAGISAKVREVETDGGRGYLAFELL